MTTQRHDHAILLCACGAVLAQCRCTEAMKPQRVIQLTCPSCLPPQPGPYTPDTWTRHLPRVTPRHDMRK